MNLKIISASLSYLLTFLPCGTESIHMGALRETVIATLPGRCTNERLEIVLRNEPGQGSCLQLRQQSWGDGVGWFTQSSVELEPEQVAALKMTLGTVPCKARRTAPSGRQSAETGSAGGALRLVRADSA